MEAKIVADADVGERIFRRRRRGREQRLFDENVAAETGLHEKLLVAASLDRWIDAWEKVARLFSRSDAVNLDRKQTVLVSFLALQSAMR